MLLGVLAVPRSRAEDSRCGERRREDERHRALDGQTVPRRAEPRYERAGEDQSGEAQFVDVERLRDDSTVTTWSTSARCRACDRSTGMRAAWVSSAYTSVSSGIMRSQMTRSKPSHRWCDRWRHGRSLRCRPRARLEDTAQSGCRLGVFFAYFGRTRSLVSGRPDRSFRVTTG